MKARVPDLAVGPVPHNAHPQKGVPPSAPPATNTNQKPDGGKKAGPLAELRSEPFILKSKREFGKNDPNKASRPNGRAPFGPEPATLEGQKLLPFLVYDAVN